MFSLVLLALNAAAAEPAPTAPQAAPYRLVICLRAAQHPLLTPRFVASVERQVHDHMRQLFGGLAEVEMATSGHWLIDDYLGMGAEAPEWTPELWDKLETPQRVFLFHLDYRDHQYKLAWRQIDSEFRWLQPIRTRETPDRQWVFRAMCLAIKDDFSVVAQVQPGNSPETVSLSLRGSEHAESLAKLVNERCVLQPYEIIRRRDGNTDYQPVPHTVLLWNPVADKRKATVHSNASQPWKTRPSTAGFLAARIPTQTGRLRLQLLDERTGAPLTNCTVYANDEGFTGLADQHILGQPDRFGNIVSDREYQHVAFVRISQGTWDRKQLPIAITEGVSSRVFRLSADPDALVRNDYERQLRFLSQDIAVLKGQQDEIAREANALNNQRRYEEAVQQLRNQTSQMRTRLNTAEQSLNELQQQARNLKGGSTTLLDFVSGEFTRVAERDREFTDLQNAFAAALRTQETGERAKKLVELAKQAERNGEFDEAIDRYELALAEVPNQTAVRERLNVLKQQWAIKNEEHRQAREFIMTQWSEAEVTEIEALLTEAKRALQVLEQSTDPLTAQRLLRVNSDHIGALNALVDQLTLRGGDADRAEADEHGALIQQLADFQGQVGDFIESSLNAAPAEPSAQPAPAAPDAAAPADSPAKSPPATPSRKKSLLDHEEEPATGEAKP